MRLKIDRHWFSIFVMFCEAQLAIDNKCLDMQTSLFPGEMESCLLMAAGGSAQVVCSCPDIFGGYNQREIQCDVTKHSGLFSFVTRKLSVVRGCSAHHKFALLTLDATIFYLLDIFELFFVFVWLSTWPWTLIFRNITIHKLWDQKKSKSGLTLPFSPFLPPSLPHLEPELFQFSSNWFNRVWLRTEQPDDEDTPLHSSPERRPEPPAAVLEATWMRSRWILAPHNKLLL